MEPSTALRHIHIFGDESSHDSKQEFMVYGTVSCEASRLPAISKALEFPDFHKEFKWSESEKYLPQHKAFVTALFDRCIKNNQGLQFRCIVVKTSHMRHREFNQRDPNLGLEKYIYRQLMRYALAYRTGIGRFHVTLDKGREEKFPPEEKRRMLNAGYKRESRFKHDAFVHVGVAGSETSRLVQAADVLAGAVAWVRNKKYRNLSNSGLKKRELVELVAGKARLPIEHKRAKEWQLERDDFMNFHLSTPQYVDSHGFSIWNFDLTAEARKDLMRVSKLQLAAIPDGRTKFGDLPGRGFQINLACAFCNDVVPYDSSDPKFEAFTVKAVYRPKCAKCEKPRVALLDPDPREIPLLSGLHR